MALWLFRAGKQGEYEKKFLEDEKVYLTWNNLKHDLSKLKDQKALYDLLLKIFPDDKPATIRNWTGQCWPIVGSMKKGDWVILPSKLKSAIHIGEIKSDYKFNSKAKDPFYHTRDIDWFATDIPRSNFEQDLLYSFGAFMTVCKISRNEAEKRIKQMAKNNWKVSPINISSKSESSEQVDLEQVAFDQIAKLIIRKFKGHGLARLVDAILKAKGYTTYISPEGPDKGIDILAAPGNLGFGSPKLCIQVKSSDSPVDRPTLDQLIGAMQNVNAEHGLLVSWGGFKSSVDKEVASQFFRVRLWEQNTIIKELLENYDKLDDDLKAELPLKRIWTLASIDESNS
jgi:restriction system protein